MFIGDFQTIFNLILYLKYPSLFEVNTHCRKKASQVRLSWNLSNKMLIPNTKCSNSEGQKVYISLINHG
jgi:hypothetical protein